jgi:DNA invertase Pin-like site-specific DNA recombinase
MSERAARWFRVSSGSQDEQNQYDDVDKHIAARGYEVARTFRLHDVSASTGEQEPELAEALADIRAGLYSVIVVAQSSRLDRRDDLNVQIAFAAQVKLAGGRVESVDEPVFGTSDLPGWMTTLIAMESNAKYSRDLKANTRRGKDRIAANSAFDGRTPWGFTTEGPRYERRLVPTDVAREYIPQIYQRIIAGQSLAQVCRWLEAEHVKPMGIAKDRADGKGKSGKWWPRSLGQLIRNPVYMGLRVTGNGRTQTTCEALVDAATWTAAGKRLSAAPKRGPVVKENRCYLSGASKCAECGGPLYKVMTGRGASRRAYLRCSGTGPDRKGCGVPLIRLETAEELINEEMDTLNFPLVEFAIEPGNGAEIDAKLAALDYERRQVAMRGLTWAEEDAERDRIRREYELVAATPRTADRRVVIPTGEDYGSRWRKADADGRAAWLRSGEFTAMFTMLPAADATAVKDGVSFIMYWLEDPDEDEEPSH